MNKKDIIIDTYKRLVIEKKTAQISVAEICREADVSRKTFYNHFIDRFEVIEHILISDIETPLLKALRLNYGHHQVVKLIFENLLLDQEFYKIAIMENNQNSLFETLIQRLTALNNLYDREDDKKGFSPREVEYLNYRFAAEIALVIRKWMEEGMMESPDFMAKIIVFPKHDKIG